MEVAAQPLDVAPPAETSSFESAEVATPAPETAQAAEAVHLVETPEAIEPVQAAEATDAPPADATPRESSVLAMLNARLEALRATAATSEPTAEATQAALPVAEVAAPPADITADLPPDLDADLATPLETSSMAIAEATAPVEETAQVEAAPDENWVVAVSPELEQSGAHASPLPADNTSDFTTAMLTAAVEAPPEDTPWSHAAVDIQQSGSDLADAVVSPSDPTPHTDASANEVVDAIAQAVELALAAQSTAEPATPAAEIAQTEASHPIEAAQVVEIPEAAETTHTVGTAETADVAAPDDATTNEITTATILSAITEALRAPGPQPETQPDAVTQAATPAAEIDQTTAAVHVTEAPEAEALTLWTRRAVAKRRRPPISKQRLMQRSTRARSSPG